MPTGEFSEDGKTPIFECTGGPEKQFDNYYREGDDLLCDYSITLNNGTVLNITEVAVCGYNAATYFFCPKRRGPNEFNADNNFDRSAWRDAPSGCHHRTSIQYCLYIQQTHWVYFDFKRVLSNIMMTSGNNYPLLAFPYQGVPNSIWATRQLERIYDSEENPQVVSG